jgi:diguanylate cyclase (GGDEF)-like protein
LLDTMSRSLVARATAALQTPAGLAALPTPPGAPRGDAWRAVAEACRALCGDAPGRAPLELALEQLTSAAGAAWGALFVAESDGWVLSARWGEVPAGALPRHAGRGSPAATADAFALELDHGGAAVGALWMGPPLGGPAAPAATTYREASPTLAAALSCRLELQQLERLCPVDRLTGVFTARHFGERLEEEVDRACRYGVSLGLVLVDVDHLAALNARCGRRAGDEALAELAHLLREQARRSDVLGRTRGGELAWLLPEADHAATGRCAERMRRAVAAHRFPRAGRISVSLGVASLPRLAADGPELRGAAERALTLAKKAGRNRVGRPARPTVH